MTHYNLIFDFDGTLADTWPLIADITHRITHKPQASEAKLARLRHLPLLQAVRRLGGRLWDVPFIVLLTRRAMLPRMNEVESFDGVLAAVKSLHRAGHRLFVLTSNGQPNATAFLEQQGIDDCFEDVRHVNVFRKARGLKALLHRHRLAVSHSFYIANEPADIETAQGTGVKSVAVTWGGQERGDLLAAQPYALVDQPQELLELFGGA